MFVDTCEARLQITHGGGITVARIAGCDRLTDETVRAVAPQLTALVGRLRRPRLLVDLQDVGFVSSVALSTFVGLHNAVQAAGGRMALVNLRPQAREVFAVTRLDTLLEVHRGPSEKSAPRACRTA